MHSASTRPAQDAVVTSLGALAEVMRDAGLSSPAVIVIGDVAALADATFVRQTLAGSKRAAVART